MGAHAKAMWRDDATPIYIVTSAVVLVTFTSVVLYNVCCVKRGNAAFQAVDQEEEDNIALTEVVESLE